MQAGVLDKPVPVIFAFCQNIQPLASGGVNLIGIFDRVTLHRGPQGQEPADFSLPVITQWTGGVGDFEQILVVVDEDGAEVVRAPRAFSLATTNARHVIQTIVVFRPRAGVYSLVLSRGDTELLRQDFTLAVADFPVQGQV